MHLDALPQVDKVLNPETKYIIRDPNGTVQLGTVPVAGEGAQEGYYFYDR